MAHWNFLTDFILTLVIQLKNTVNSLADLQILQKIAPAPDLAVHLAPFLLQLPEKCCSPEFLRFLGYLALIHCSLPVQSLFSLILLCSPASLLLPFLPDSLSPACAFGLQHVFLS